MRRFRASHDDRLPNDDVPLRADPPLADRYADDSECGRVMNEYLRMERSPGPPVGYLVSHGMGLASGRTVPQRVDYFHDLVKGDERIQAWLETPGADELDYQWDLGESIRRCVLAGAQCPHFDRVAAQLDSMEEAFEGVRADLLANTGRSLHYLDRGKASLVEFIQQLAPDLHQATKRTTDQLASPVDLPDALEEGDFSFTSPHRAKTAVGAMVEVRQRLSRTLKSIPASDYYEELADTLFSSTVREDQAISLFPLEGRKWFYGSIFIGYGGIYMTLVVVLTVMHILLLAARKKNIVISRRTSGHFHRIWLCALVITGLLGSISMCFFSWQLSLYAQASAACYDNDFVRSWIRGMPDLQEDLCEDMPFDFMADCFVDGSVHVTPLAQCASQESAAETLSEVPLGISSSPSASTYTSSSHTFQQSLTDNRILATSLIFGSVFENTSANPASWPSSLRGKWQGFCVDRMISPHFRVVTLRQEGGYMDLDEYGVVTSFGSKTLNACFKLFSGEVPIRDSLMDKLRLESDESDIGHVPGIRDVALTMNVLLDRFELPHLCLRLIDSSCAQGDTLEWSYPTFKDDMVAMEVADSLFSGCEGYSDPLKRYCSRLIAHAGNTYATWFEFLALLRLGVHADYVATQDIWPACRTTGCSLLTSGSDSPLQSFRDPFDRTDLISMTESDEWDSDYGYAHHIIDALTIASVPDVPLPAYQWFNKKMSCDIGFVQIKGNVAWCSRSSPISSLASLTAFCMAVTLFPVYILLYKLWHYHFNKYSEGLVGGYHHDLDPLEMLVAISEGDSKLVNAMLTRSGIYNIENVTDDNRSSALHYACEANQCGMVQLLLEHHARPNDANLEGYTPLHIALYEANLEIVHLLLANGADPNLCDANGDPPLLGVILHDAPTVSQNMNLLLALLASEALLATPEAVPAAEAVGNAEAVALLRDFIGGDFEVVKRIVEIRNKFQEIGNGTQSGGENDVHVDENPIIDKRESKDRFNE
eukprot:GHVH01013236.1.p1 GENE.GHVH01013236.1~~GHVH01013236.1.p1  ORF type:complete len:993 (-),score=175.67 GHVH01013236.1:1089-4067(-)